MEEDIKEEPEEIQAVNIDIELAVENKEKGLEELLKARGSAEKTPSSG